MAEMKTIVTIMKKGRNLSSNKYVQGRISGMQEALLTSLSIKTIHDVAIELLREHDGVWVSKALGSEEACESFKELVTLNYPYLCEFYYV